MPTVSLIVPIRNEARYIAQCLDSILEFDYPESEMEVLLVDGMSDDGTREIVREYQRLHPGLFRLLDNPRRIVPVAMNLGIREAKGEYIVRLDAHTRYPREYLRRLLRAHERLGADNVGGCAFADVQKTTPTAAAIKNLLRDPLGVGNALFRTGVDEVMEVDTVPFGCFRRELFDRIGLYDERLERNQDIELNSRIRKGGGKIYLLPDLHCTYYARERFASLAKNGYENGKWNLLTAFYTSSLSSLGLRHYVPLLFVLGLLGPLAIGPFWPPILFVSLALGVIYMTVIGYRCVKISKNTTLFHQLLAFVILHMAYGIGSLIGIVEGLLSWRKGKHVS